MKEKILRLRKNGLTYDEIKKELGCSKSTISYHCRKNGLNDSNYKFKPKDEESEEMQKIYDECGSIREVAKRVERNRGGISKYITKKKMTEEERKKNNSKKVISWRKRTKLKLVEYKGGKCQECGYNKCVQALDFHHLDPKEKDFSISGKSWSFERLKKRSG